MRTLINYIVLTLLFSLAAGCSRNSGTIDGEHNHETAAHSDEHAGEHASENVITVSDVSRKAMGLELQTVCYRAMEQTFAVTGEIARDTEKVFHVTSPIAGTIAGIRVKYCDMVKPGDVLATVQTSQATRDIVSTHSGMVTAITAEQGQQVDEITSILSISDLSTINANFDVYEKDAGKIRVGQRMKVKSMAYVGKVFPGKIVFISPRIDENSRTIKVRAEIDNTGYLLKFGMFVTGDIVISEGQFLSVPSKAIQKVNDRSIVFVASGEKEFTAIEVATGFEDAAYSQILGGLKPDAAIAVEGSFLLKSELLKSEMGDGCAE
jgi:multidrug efflux pump subunit AcrA (membrane-fusion protein)